MPLNFSDQQKRTYREIAHALQTIHHFYNEGSWLSVDKIEHYIQEANEVAVLEELKRLRDHVIDSIQHDDVEPLAN